MYYFLVYWNYFTILTVYKYKYFMQNYILETGSFTYITHIVYLQSNLLAC